MLAVKIVVIINAQQAQHTIACAFHPSRPAPRYSNDVRNRQKANVNHLPNPDNKARSRSDEVAQSSEQRVVAASGRLQPVEAAVLDVRATPDFRPHDRRAKLPDSRPATVAASRLPPDEVILPAPLCD